MASASPRGSPSARHAALAVHHQGQRQARGAAPGRRQRGVAVPQAELHVVGADKAAPSKGPGPVLDPSPTPRGPAPRGHRAPHFRSELVMKNGRTLVRLAQELERQLNSKKDLVVHL